MKKSYLHGPAGYRIQKTLQRTVAFQGIGLHTGAHGRVRIEAAETNTGILFRRLDTKGATSIPAHYANVRATQMATTLGNPQVSGTEISTVEHLLAALYSLGVTNALVYVDGPEIPILDGSAAEFCDGILDAGLEIQNHTAPSIKILKPIHVSSDGCAAVLVPRSQLRLTTTINFSHPSIGYQTYAMELSPGKFREEISAARTFGFSRDLEKLKAKSLAKGASLHNVLAFSEEGILNSGGTRYPDECVRHKLLDAIGDLALCGAWIEGEMVSYRAGHHMHIQLLLALQKFPDRWKFSPAEQLISNRAPHKEATLETVLLSV